jgi:hypothetical protein
MWNTEHIPHRMTLYMSQHCRIIGEHILFGSTRALPRSCRKFGQSLTRYGLHQRPAEPACGAIDFVGAQAQAKLEGPHDLEAWAPGRRSDIPRETLRE